MEGDHLDYYRILQVDPNAEPEVIAGAYRRLALKNHPDTSKSPGAKGRMQDINLAYEVLGDPVKRASYDAERNARLAKLGAQRNTPAGRDSVKPRPGAAQPGRFKRELVYRSDFYSPSNQWGEPRLPQAKAFRKDGHYHIAVLRPHSYRYQFTGFYLEDFAVYVDAQFARNSGNTATHGIVFRLTKGPGFDDYYVFLVSQGGYYALMVTRNREWQVLLDYRFSEYLRRDCRVNRLMVEVVGHRITLGANGELLASVADDSLSAGSVGLYVGTDRQDDYAEARFHDFRLFSVESDAIAGPWRF